MTRITVSCPEQLISDANQLAMALAFGPADGETYRSPNWQDTDGNFYAAASFVASPEWIETAQAELSRPSWDTDEIIDMTAAARAQAVLSFWNGGGDAPSARPDAITAIAGMEGLAALAAMGLFQKIEEMND